MPTTQITNYTLTARDATNSVISWTGTANVFVYLFINGSTYATGNFIASTSKTFVIPFGSNEIVSIDLSEDVNLLDVFATSELPDVRPFVKWTESKAADVLRYRIYVDSVKVDEETHITDKVHYTKQLTDPISHGWHLFEIMAVDTFDQESVADSYHFWVHDVPDSPSVSLNVQILQIGV